MFAEGQRVVYSGGASKAFLANGDEGVIVSLGNTGSYVKWESGRMEGEFVQVSHSELEDASPNRDRLAGLISFSVKEVAESRGAIGLLDELNRSGHTANFEEIAMQAGQLAGSLVRVDPAMREVLAELDPYEADNLVAISVVSLLRDQFGRDS